MCVCVCACRWVQEGARCWCGGRSGRSRDVPGARADNVKKGDERRVPPRRGRYSRYTSVNYTHSYTKEPKQTSRPRLLCSRIHNIMNYDNVGVFNKRRVRRKNIHMLITRTHTHKGICILVHGG